MGGSNRSGSSSAATNAGTGDAPDPQDPLIPVFERAAWMRCHSHPKTPEFRIIAMDRSGPPLHALIATQNEKARNVNLTTVPAGHGHAANAEVSWIGRNAVLAGFR